MKEEKENYAFYLALSSELNSNKNTWIIDSGESQHIIGFRDKFDSILEYSLEEITTRR